MGRLFSLLSLGFSFVLGGTLLGCAGGAEDEGHTTYGLKVVVQPQSGTPSSSCSVVGSASPSTMGNSLGDDLWLEKTSHTQQGSTWYDVRLVRQGSHAILGGWRFDEKMAREQHELRAYVADVHGAYHVRITGSFERDVVCAP